MRIGRLELWWSRVGNGEGNPDTLVWYRPSEWQFSIDRYSCYNGCLMVEIGFFGFTWLKGGCIE